MAKPVPVEVRIADLPQIQQFNASVVALLEALGDCTGLPEPVMSAMDRLRRDVEALSPDAPASDEDRIRDAMAEAQDHPGRVVTR